MDSSFVNYDGRSVHDMIETLLAASGDPEAIRRLQEAIQAVDAKFTPVNEELVRLENDKQDAGNYVVNGGAPGYTQFRFTESAHVMDMRRSSNQYSNGIAIMGSNSEADADGVIREWFRYERNSGQLQGYIFKEGGSGWEAVHTWQADEDTGWQTIEGELTTVACRRKNGVVEIKLGQNATKKLEQSNNAATLPAGFRPSSVLFFDCNIWLNSGGWKGYPVIAELRTDGSLRITQVPSEVQAGAVGTVTFRSMFAFSV